MLQLINTIITLIGFITSIVGIALLPQSISQPHRGTAESYNNELQHQQLQSLGFKLIVIGLSILVFGTCSGLVVCLYKVTYSKPAIIHPQP